MTGPPSPKRQRTGDKPEAAVDPEKLQAVLDKLAPVNESIEAENNKMAEEVLVIENKYNKTKRPFFEKRAELLREIPGFWKQTLNNHPFVAISIAEEEQPILDFLQDIDVVFTDEKGGFKIEFTFGENPYFKNKVLSKTVTFKDEEDEVEVDSAEIEWKNTTEANAVKDQAQFFERLSTEEGDAEFAEQIKDDIWKDPVPVYLNVADSDDEEGDEEGDEDDEDDSAEDEE